MQTAILKKKSRPAIFIPIFFLFAMFNLFFTSLPRKYVPVKISTIKSQEMYLSNILEMFKIHMNRFVKTLWNGEE